jgi:hypothetical protein
LASLPDSPEESSIAFQVVEVDGERYNKLSVKETGPAVDDAVDVQFYHYINLTYSNAANSKRDIWVSFLVLCSYISLTQPDWSGFW